MIRRQLIRFYFTKITKDDVVDSNYEQLIDKIVQQYGYKEFQTPSAVSLLEAHHLYKIFKPGDWVLDIGAGPYWSWTDLALKLTSDAEHSNLVLSNDKIDMLIKKQNNIAIRGDFLQESTRSKIALNLIQKPVDTILIDAVDQYTGEPNVDANYTMSVFAETMRFSDRYLKKGGNIVLRTLQTPFTQDTQQKSQFFFNEVYKHKPSNIPVNSFSLFYILKGFRMTTRLDQIQSFLKQYKKASSSKKNGVVEKYKAKYIWDPIKIINNQAKIKIRDLKQKGYKNSQIVKMYEKQKFIKAKQIVKLIDIINDQKASSPAKIKANQKFFYDRNITDPKILPQNQKQFHQALLYHAEKVHEKLQNEELNKDKKQEKKPLKDDQVYMKEIKIREEQDQQLQKKYKQQDLLGYKPANSVQEDDFQQLEEQQLKKLIDSFPSLDKFYDSQDTQTKQKAFQILKETMKTRGQRVRQKSKKDQKYYTQGQKEILQLLSEQPDIKGLTDKKQQFTFGRDTMDSHMKSDIDESESLKKQYMKSKEKKSDRYINQRKSKRKNRQKNF